MASSNLNLNQSPPLTPMLRRLCLDHLHREAEVLTAALAAVRAMDDAFGLHSPKGLALAISRHAQVAARIDELQRHRSQFREAAARLLAVAPNVVTVGVVLNRLPAHERSPIAAELASVRLLAQQLTPLNQRVSICVRIHLDAYQRILRDLTNSRQGSGRYGPTGAAESHEYQPLIQIHG
jgi:hypothetical protein